MILLLSNFIADLKYNLTDRFDISDGAVLVWLFSEDVTYTAAEWTDFPWRYFAVVLLITVIPVKREVNASL